MATSDDVRQSGAPLDPHDHTPERGHGLKPGAIGLMAVLFMAVANAAPITAMTGNTPIAIGYGNGIGAPAGFLVATIVLTLFTIGFIAMARYITTAGELLRLRHPRPRPGLGHGHRCARDDGLRRLRGLADRHLRLLHQRRAEPLVRRRRQLADPRSHRHRPDRLVRLLRHPHRRGVPRRHPGRRGAAARRAGVLGAVQRRRAGRDGARGDQPAQRVQEPRGGRRRRRGHRRHGHRRRQRSHRGLLRVLVLGRLRDDGGLRRGVAQPEAHRAAGDHHRRGRARHLLHVRVLDDDRRQRQASSRSRRPTPTRSACGSTWPRTSSAARSSATSTCSSS